jgi:hypothetical protein
LTQVLSQFDGDQASLGLPLKIKLRDLSANMVISTSRIDASLNVLMATLSLYESQRGIEEASEVTKLTKFGHFYLPITLVVGLFSMDATPFKPTFLAFLVASFLALFTSLLILNISGIRQPNAFVFASKAVRLAGHFLEIFFLRTWRLWGVLLVLAAVGVGSWRAIMTDWAPSVMAGVVTIFGIVAVSTIVGALLYYLRRRSGRTEHAPA